MSADEPTNHLDMDSREVLENALADYAGTIVAVSHDRYFINRFAEKVCVLEDGALKEYLGNYDSYFEKVRRAEEPDGETAGMTRTAIDKEKRKSREEQQRIRAEQERMKALENRIAEAEKKAAEMEKELADPETWKNPEEAAEKTKQYNAMKEEIEKMYEELF